MLKWGVPETKLMLDLVSTLLNQVGPLKKFRMKKHMWAHIATKLSEKFGLEINALQTETRYKCVMKRTKKAIINNNTSGSSREVTEYDDEIDRIVRMDDSVCPDFLCAPGIITEKEDLFPSQGSTMLPLSSSLRSTLRPSTSSPLDSTLRPSTSSSFGSTACSSTSSSATQSTVSMPSSPRTLSPERGPLRRKRKSATESLFEKFIEYRKQNQEEREVEKKGSMKSGKLKNKKRKRKKLKRKRKKKNATMKKWNY